MTNILKAIKNIMDRPIIQLRDFYTGRNRANSIGESLENYVKDCFADTFELNEADRITHFNEVFSYLGNQNNPPDIILKNGDAIETKKVQSLNSNLALNSSYPKAKLFSSSPMLTKACKECETWVEKDIIYAIGHTSDIEVKQLWFIYGDCFAADKEVYDRIKDVISSGVNDISDIEFTETKELGKVKKVDPLGVTDLRIRGMWHIENPNKIFSYLGLSDSKAKFQLLCLIKKEKFDSFPEIDKQYLLTFTNENYLISDIKIKSPNNPVDLMEAKLITFKIL